MLDDYMRSQKLPAQLREKVKDHFHLQHNDGKLFDEEEILAAVTPILRREIVSYKHREVLLKVPLLQNTEENAVFALEVASKLAIDIVFMDEVVVRENMSGSEMCVRARREARAKRVFGRAKRVQFSSSGFTGGGSPPDSPLACPLLPQKIIGSSSATL
jgi:hypothetical protein